VDLAWPTLLLLGVERVRIVPGITAVTPLDFEYYPATHSLLAGVLWGIALCLLYFFFTRYRRGAIVAGVLVVSHWLLDFVVHRPDLPLYPGSAKVGFGLWDSLLWTLITEFGLLAAGAALYVRCTRALDRTGNWALWSLLAFLCLIQVGNVFGPPPPSVAAIAWVGQAQWLLVVWGYWVDRHRGTLFPDRETKQA
jgi:membrane-bound metal-dependent hydrolase YbcI (DUF457 family)